MVMELLLKKLKGYYMNKAELIEKCTIFAGVVVDNPYKEDVYNDITVVKHKSNNKCFGFIYTRDNELCINLKAEPVDVTRLKEKYPDFIKPAWRMVKRHWCTVLVNKADEKVLNSLIETSYEITSKN